MGELHDNGDNEMNPYDNNPFQPVRDEDPRSEYWANRELREAK